MQPANNGKTDGTEKSAPEWFAAYVKHQHERKAALLLEQRGVEVLLPQREVLHQWKDRSKRLLLPVFPGYLFLRSDVQDKFRILNTPGVFFLVESGGHACSIPEHEIEWIRLIARTRVRADAHPYISTGDRVRICKGPLAGITGLLTRIKNQCRVVLTVELLQKALSIEVELGNLERLREFPGTRYLEEYQKTA